METAVPDILLSIPTIPGEQGPVAEGYNTWFFVGECLVTLGTYLTHKDISANTCNLINCRKSSGTRQIQDSRWPPFLPSRPTVCRATARQPVCRRRLFPEKLVRISTIGFFGLQKEPFVFTLAVSLLLNRCPKEENMWFSFQHTVLECFHRNRHVPFYHSLDR